MTDASPRTIARADILHGDWPDAISVLISPGVGGGHREGGAFGPTARIVYDGLEAASVGVAYAITDQQPSCVLMLMSADWWGPVLTFGRDVLSGVASAAIYDVIKRSIGKTQEAHGPDVRAHLDLEEVSEVTAEGERQVRTISLSGDPDTVLDGLEQMIRNHIDGSQRNREP